MFGNKSHKKFYRVGGTRGGQDQFKWEDVKTDKYRENYLGNSLLAPVGRWQKGKDLTWYAKNGNKSEADLESERIEEEKRRLRDLDDDLLNQALGIKTEKKKWNTSSQMDNDDLKYLLARGKIERDDEEKESDRIGGLGAGSMRFHDHIERKSSLQREIEKLKTEEQTKQTGEGVDGKEGSGEDGDQQPRKKARYIALQGSNSSSLPSDRGEEDIVMKRDEEEGGARGAGDDSSSDSSSEDKAAKKHKSEKSKKHKKDKKHSKKQKKHKKHRSHHDRDDDDDEKDRRDRR